MGRTLRLLLPNSIFKMIFYCNKGLIMELSKNKRLPSANACVTQHLYSRVPFLTARNLVSVLFTHEEYLMGNISHHDA